MELPNPYANKNYKRLLAIPIVLLLFSFYFMFHIPKGVELQGGILVTVQLPQGIDEEKLSADLVNELGVKEVKARELPNPMGVGLEVEIEQNEKLADAEKALRVFYKKLEEVNSLEFDILSNQEQLKLGNLTDEERAKLQAEMESDRARLETAKAEMNRSANIVFVNSEEFIGKVDMSNATDSSALKLLVENSFSKAQATYREKILTVMRSHVEFQEYSFREVSPTLSEFFMQRTIEVLVVAFVLTAFAVLIIFRNFIPSFAIMFAAFNDIAIALGAMGFFGIPLTLPSIAALLMLVGYAIDTSMLLSIRVLKRAEGDPRERAHGAMKTGLMMAVTAILAFSALFAVAMVTQLPTYYQIASVVIAGLVGDIFATWCMNACILLWHLERKGEIKYA